MRARPVSLRAGFAFFPFLACSSLLGLEQATPASDGVVAAAGCSGLGTAPTSGSMPMGGTHANTAAEQAAAGSADGNSAPSGAGFGTAGTLMVVAAGRPPLAGAMGIGMSGGALSSRNPAAGAAGLAAGAAGSTASATALAVGAAGLAAGAAGSTASATALAAGATGLACSADPVSIGGSSGCSCEAGSLVWCEDGRLRTKACASSALCDAKQCQCDVCVVGTKTCLDRNMTDTCDPNGQGHVYASCQAPAPYCSDGTCVACLADSDCVSSSASLSCQLVSCSAEHTCIQRPATAGNSCGDAVTPGVCDGQGHCGECIPDDKRCNTSGVPERCVSDGTNGGHWEAGAAACESPTPFCVAGDCEPPPSCRGMGAEDCGTNHEHCCLSPRISGMTYSMGSDDQDWSESNERPAHPATVGRFRLDAFEVTVGRFRRFVTDYKGPPAEGTGADPYRIDTTGWQSQWASEVPSSSAELRARLAALPSTSTWTPEVAGRELLPINHVDWYLAFAFCAYDGGWLPSEAEWERAASGDDPQKKNFYPWGGSPTVDFDTSYATFDLTCLPNSCGAVAAFRPVGSAPNGRAIAGQYDLAGSVAEWTLDIYDESYYSQFVGIGGCEFCVNTAAPRSGTGPYRVTRGGNATSDALSLRVTRRDPIAPSSTSAGVGIRCARPE
jgi:formylglycine-generating enzyme